MNPSYVRIRLPLTTAMSRFANWIGLPELTPARTVKTSEAVAQACDGDDWLGVAVFVHEANNWSVFDDFTGDLASVPASRWADLALGDELIFAGYNDAVPYGQLIVFRDRKVAREFLEDLQDPAHNINVGRLDFEDRSPINGWIAAASFVDSEDLADPGADEGLLWLFRRAT